MLVGARCAASAVGRLLARRGDRILHVDREAFPSDLPMSTQLVQHGGGGYLAREGLHDRVVATNSPSISRFDEELVAAELSRWPV
jgi:hypothetical protein